jgi:hypothetical protein
MARNPSRINWAGVGLVTALIALAVIFTFRYQFVTMANHVYRIDTLLGKYCEMPCAPTPGPPAMSNGPTPTPFNEQAFMAGRPLQEQLAYASAQRIASLDASVPHDGAYFTPFPAYYFHADDLIEGVFESSDGTLYAVASHCQMDGPGCERYHFAYLYHGSLNEIWLPHGMEEWTYMVLDPASGGETAVVDATAEDGVQYRYSVSTNGIVREPNSAPGTPQAGASAPETSGLSSGERCVVDTARDSNTLVWAVGVNGRRRALVAKRAFVDVTNGILQPSDAQGGYCQHFRGIDMLVVGGRDDRSATFVIDAKGIRFAAPAAPVAFTTHHMLLAITEDPGVAYDYFDVDASRASP